MKPAREVDGASAASARRRERQEKLAAVLSKAAAVRNLHQHVLDLCNKHGITIYA